MHAQHDRQHAGTDLLVILPAKCFHACASLQDDKLFACNALAIRHNPQENLGISRTCMQGRRFCTTASTPQQTENLGDHLGISLRMPKGGSTLCRTALAETCKTELLCTQAPWTCVDRYDETFSPQHADSIQAPTTSLYV